MATIIIGGFGLALAGSYFEKRVLPDMLPALFEPSTVMPALPRAFAGVVLVSVLSGFWITLYGLSVGSKRKASVFVCRRVRGVCSRARTCVTRSHALSATSNSSLPYQITSTPQIYKAKAEKDGEENCEARYSLPNLYVAGSTKHSKAFNCWQRSHQQALETLPQVYATTLFAGLAFPVTTTLGGLWWLAGRITWATGYAASEGNPAARYSHPLAKGIWSGYMVNLGLAVMTVVNFSGLYNFW